MKITFLAYIQLIIYVLLSIIGIYIVMPFTVDGAFILILFFIIIITIYPCVLILHYYKYDRNTILIIDEANKLMIHRHGNESLTIPFMDIKRIYLVTFPGRALFMHYHKLILRNHSPIVISGLVIRDFKKFGFDVQFIYKYNLFLNKSVSFLN